MNLMMRVLSVGVVICVVLVAQMYVFHEVNGGMDDRYEEDDVVSEPDADSFEEDFSSVTCGSVIKLMHKNSRHRLHSHDIKWGSGSGQQSVTAMKTAVDPNSYWAVKAANGVTCATGTPVACDSTVRLMHVKTSKFLHSHLHRSPLSGHQEISAYGPQSDTGDHWVVQCSDDKHTDAKVWKWGASVKLRHVDTAKYLYTANSNEFNNRNCRGCPIVGQLEVSAYGSAYSPDTLWRAREGFYFPSMKEEPTPRHTHNDL